MPIGHAVHFHPAVQEDRIDQGPFHQHINVLVLEHGLGANWNAGRDWQDVGEEVQHDDAGVFGGNVREEEEPNRHPGEARILDLFEELFGDGGETPVKTTTMTTKKTTKKKTNSRLYFNISGDQWSITSMLPNILNLYLNNGTIFNPSPRKQLKYQKGPRLDDPFISFSNPS
ncbi:hypothetical protein JOM56_007803 [Amanita muscaria]